MVDGEALRAAVAAHIASVLGADGEQVLDEALRLGRL